MSTGMAFGVANMVDPLGRVAMRRPGRAMLEADPGIWHYAGPLDPARLSDQYEAFVALVAATGAKIEWLPAADDGLADSIFTFDPSLMTDEGAVLLRPGKRLRRPEVDLHRGFFADIGVPILASIEAPGTVEAGDCLRLDEDTLVVGRGFRTNRAGVDQLRSILRPLGISIQSFDLPVWEGAEACMHLLTIISPLDRDLALVYRRLLPVALYELLLDRGVECLVAPDDEFSASGGLNLNVLATAPRTCVAIDGFPGTARIMQEAGCDVTLFPADALCIPCEGGPTCLTLPIARG